MRQTCETLKSIRKQIADKNGIAYEPNVCTYKGPCSGTCPVCEAEAHYIETELKKRQNANQPVNIIGVAKDKLPAPSSFSQTIAAATITAALSFTALPATAAEKNEKETTIERKDLVMVRGVINDGVEGLPNVRVSIKGTETFTETDKHGNFSIKASIGDYLVIECHNRETDTIRVTNADKVTHTMSAPRIRLVGAVSSLSNSEPPLYVVDGHLLNCDDHIDPFEKIKHADIESMEVLKDEKDIAPYKTFCKNASQGVILIKTKSGKKQ